MTGIVFVALIFILLQREDLRDRMIAPGRDATSIAVIPRLPKPLILEERGSASPRLRAEGCRRQQACAAGEGEGAMQEEARRLLPDASCGDAPSPPLRYAPLVLAKAKTLSPQAGRGGPAPLV